MLRHGFWPYPSRDPLNPPPYGNLLGFKQPDVFFEEKLIDPSSGLKGLWAIKDPRRKPDVVVLYLHGGGFAMGSPWFYLEFLLAWIDLLCHGGGQSRKQWRNPAVFALDYTLVPAATFPTQVLQTLKGWDWLCDVAGDAKLELAGDSAGATLCLSLLLLLAQGHAPTGTGVVGEVERRKPDHATLVSAWCRLISPLNKDTTSDYLNAESLHLYAKQYLGSRDGENDEGVDAAIASPTDFKGVAEWKRAIPVGGCHFIHGAEELLGGEIRSLVQRLGKLCGEGKDSMLMGEKKIVVSEEEAGIHAWPVVDLFLGMQDDRRLKGLRRIVDVVNDHIEDSNSLE